MNIIDAGKKGFKAFFDIREEERRVESAKKIAITTVGRFFYGLGDYVIAFGLGAMIFWMMEPQVLSFMGIKLELNFSERDRYLATLLYDFVASAGFYWLSDMSGSDMTLGNSFRRLADLIAKNGMLGKIFSVLLLLGVSIKAIAWEGPEVICFLFKKELKRRENIWLALFILSALQAILGDWLYTTGYKLLQYTVLDGNVVLGVIVTFVSFVVLMTILTKIPGLIMSFWKFFSSDEIDLTNKCFVVGYLIMVAVLTAMLLSVVG